MLSWVLKTRRWARGDDLVAWPPGGVRSADRGRWFNDMVLVASEGFEEPLWLLLFMDVTACCCCSGVRYCFALCGREAAAAAAAAVAADGRAGNVGGAWVGLCGGIWGGGRAGRGGGACLPLPLLPLGGEDIVIGCMRRGPLME